MPKLAGTFFSGGGVLVYFLNGTFCSISLVFVCGVFYKISRFFFFFFWLFCFKFCLTFGVCGFFFFRFGGVAILRLGGGGPFAALLKSGVFFLRAWLPWFLSRWFPKQHFHILSRQIGFFLT